MADCAIFCILATKINKKPPRICKGVFVRVEGLHKQRQKRADASSSCGKGKKHKRDQRPKALKQAGFSTNPQRNGKRCKHKGGPRQHIANSDSCKQDDACGDGVFIYFHGGTSQTKRAGNLKRKPAT